MWREQGNGCAERWLLELLFFEMGQFGIYFLASGIDYDGFAESPVAALRPALPGLPPSRCSLGEGEEGCVWRLFRSFHSAPPLVRPLAVQEALVRGPGPGLDLVGGQTQGQARCQRPCALLG